MINDEHTFEPNWTGQVRQVLDQPVISDTQAISDNLLGCFSLVAGPPLSLLEEAHLEKLKWL